ncbi:hypothetical protein ACSMXM_15705 [Pacificimonas sp. ICDLI1SI03]
MQIVGDSFGVGLCNLCGEQREIVDSHMIPKFAFKWMKDTSPTGVFRSKSNPNLVPQDGPHRHFLCSKCESTLNDFETPFANVVFHPRVLEEDLIGISYGLWLKKFCVSLLWRVMVMSEHNQKLKNEFSHIEKNWREYTLGETANNCFPIYFIAMKPLRCLSHVDLIPPKNWNLFILRSIGHGVISVKGNGGVEDFLYVKLARFLILGKLSTGESQYIQRQVKEDGSFEAIDSLLPRQLYHELVREASTAENWSEAMSERQWTKMAEASEKVTADQRAFVDIAKRLDAHLFGSAALERAVAEEYQARGRPLPKRR